VISWLLAKLAKGLELMWAKVAETGVDAAVTNSDTKAQTNTMVDDQRQRWRWPNTDKGDGRSRRGSR
jgi:hypothetical protein